MIVGDRIEPDESGGARVAATARGPLQIMKRLHREMRMMQRSNALQEDGIKIFVEQPFTNGTAAPNPTQWHALVRAPDGTMYENLNFWVEINFPDTYPWDSMEMRFLTPCAHPNVSITTGEICSDLFHRAAGSTHSGWSSTVTTHAALIALRSLFDDPNPSSPLNVAMAAAIEHIKATKDERVRTGMRKALRKHIVDTHRGAPPLWSGDDGTERTRFDPRDSVLATLACNEAAVAR